jgi:geranylgeranyl diphosphate synthase type I
LIKALNALSDKVNSCLDDLLVGRKPEDLYSASNHLIEAGGKRVRPFIVLQSCKIVGGNVEKAIPVAVAVELVHNFTLIHDDIMDGDETRRGAPTVHMKYGVPMAINAGDMLFAKAYEAVLMVAERGVSTGMIIKLLEKLTRVVQTVCEGQALDMTFENRNSVDEEEYMRMISQKTAALLVASAEMGALVGGGSEKQVNHLSQAMNAAGLAFQIADDVLGVTANERVLGKPVGSDIREGKKTIMVCHAINHATTCQKRLLLRTLGNKSSSTEDIEESIAILRSTGSIDHAMKKAEDLIQSAKFELELFPKTDAKDLMISLVEYFISRDR